MESTSNLRPVYDNSNYQARITKSEKGLPDPFQLDSFSGDGLRTDENASSNPPAKICKRTDIEVV